MSDLESRFAAAAAAAQSLPQRPDNNQLLRLYALYKQGTSGDVSGKRPGITDFVGRAKHDAWSALAGMSEEEAMAAYIELVESLQSS